MAGDGDAAIPRDDIRVDVPSPAPRAADEQNGAAVLESMRHRHEVVLSADTAHHAAVLECVRGDGTRQGHDETGVHKTRMNALAPLDLFVSVQLIHIVDARHTDLLAIGAAHLTQRFVKTLGAEEEAGMRHLPSRHATLEDVRAIELEKPVDEHLGRRVEAIDERAGSANAVDERAEAIEHTEVLEHAPVGSVLLVSQLEAVSDRVP